MHIDQISNAISTSSSSENVTVLISM